MAPTQTKKKTIEIVGIIPLTADSMVGFGPNPFKLIFLKLKIQRNKMPGAVSEDLGVSPKVFYNSIRFVSYHLAIKNPKEGGEAIATKRPLMIAFTIH